MPDQIAIPPVTGIARRKRVDAGVPRTSTMDSFYDRFMDLGTAQQRVVIDVLSTLHRQALSRTTLNPAKPKESGAA
jgi:hypothetical protein